MSRHANQPDWDRLFEVAVAQEGLFTTQQAAQAGYSPQLLAHHLGSGRMVRVQRGIYRVVHFPAGEFEDLTRVWLWSERAGVFSHQTALALHDLSDVLPAHIHVSLPESWRGRRLRVPKGVTLHHGSVSESERRSFGPVPATGVVRTIADCAAGGLSPEHLQRAVEDALERGMATRDELEPLVDSALSAFGGLR